MAFPDFLLRGRKVFIYDTTFIVYGFCMPKRRGPTPDEKLASALLHMAVPDENGVLVRVFTAEEREQLKGATAAAVCSLFQFDHGKLHGLADDDAEAEELMHPTNLTPRLIVAHRIKSAVDTRLTAKTRRIAAAHAQHLVAVSVAKEPDKQPDKLSPPAPRQFKKKWGSKPFPKRSSNWPKRKMRLK